MFNFKVKAVEKFGITCHYKEPYPEIRIDEFLRNLLPQEMEELYRFIDDGGILSFSINPSKIGVMAEFSLNAFGQPIICIYNETPNFIGDLKNAGIFHHEFTHYLQWKRGDITWDSKGLAYWKGEFADTSFANYDPTKQPWEKEAWGAQAELVKRYKKELPKKKRLFGLF